MRADVIERAAEAWIAASKHAYGKPGRNDNRKLVHTGPTADEIIEEVAPFSEDPRAYLAYEQAVRERASLPLGWEGVPIIV